MGSFFSPPPSSTPSLGSGLEPWHPECKFELFGTGLDVSELTPAAEGFDAKEVAIRFIAKRYSVDADSLFYLNGYEDDTTKHVFVGETYNGTPFTNEVSGHVVFNRQNKVVTSSSSLVTIVTALISSSTPTISLQEAIKRAEETLHGTCVPPTVSAADTGDDNKFLQYLPNADGSATLVYAISIDNDTEGTNFLAYVDAHKGNVAAALNYAVR